jgi:hypothetical protein
MTDATPPKRPARKKRDWARLGRALVRLLLALVRRTYAVAVIVLVLWLSFLALRYLIATLILPPPVPPQVVGIPTRLGESVLKTQRAQWPGVQASENPRTPLAHYHLLPGWIEPDRFNNCTQTGCHVPLPHSKNKAVRAFLNMHATSLQCCVCHMQVDQRPLPLGWYSLAEGQRCPVPAVLQAFAWLTSEAGRRALAAPTEADQAHLAELLRTAARQAEGDPTLQQLARDIAAVRYSSPALKGYMADAQALLPHHFRGEYGAKLALLNPTSQPVLGFPNTQAAVQTYLREAPTAAPARKAELLTAVHPLRRPQPPFCSDCHVRTGGLIDFSAMGYPPARVDMLTQAIIFRMMEHIASGQPFYLPGFIWPESQPASQPE